MNNESSKQYCQGNQKNLGNDNSENDNRSQSFYQDIGSRTALIGRLIKSQFPPPMAEAIAFGVYGNPLGGGNQNG